MLFFMVTVDGKLDGGRLDGGNGCFGKGIAADNIGMVGDEGFGCTVEYTGVNIGGVKLLLAFSFTAVLLFVVTSAIAVVLMFELTFELTVVLILAVSEVFTLAATFELKVALALVL